MKFLKYLLLVPFLYSATLSAAPYTPSCPSGTTLQIKQFVKDKCVHPTRVIVKAALKPMCRTGQVSNAGSTVRLIPPGTHGWDIVPQTNRDFCENKTRRRLNTACPQGFTMVKNASGNRDECHKLKTVKSFKTKIACNSLGDRHRKRGRDVCEP